jgi:hypothetical protein
MALTNEMKDIGQVLLLMFALGLLLVILRKPIAEGFSSGGANRCGIDLGPCEAGLKCVNGFCAQTEPREAYEKEPVPLLNQGGSFPYF